MLISILTGSGDLVYKLTYLGLYLIAIVLSLSVHEWAHAFVAHLNGDDTAKIMGRMTLNPLAHIDPAGIVLLLLIGFGWAKPVPVNSRNYKKYRLGEFTVSFAGIFMNLVLAFISAFAFVAVTASAIRKGQEPNQYLVLFFNMMGIINCALAVFNLIPVYPLDGSHIFELIFGKLIGYKALSWLHRNGRFLLYGIFILSYLLYRTTGVSPVSSVANGIFGAFVDLFAHLFGF
ncbi:MAG: site-2 protease family protein [Clostridia bacterium]|nr:site-2 protease family protein [Clostridia bacterium]